MKEGRREGGKKEQRKFTFVLGFASLEAKKQANRVGATLN